MKTKQYSLDQAVEFIRDLHDQNPNKFMDVIEELHNLLYCINRTADFLELTPRRVREKIHQGHFDSYCYCPCGRGNWLIPGFAVKKEKIDAEVRGAKYKRKNIAPQPLTHSVLHGAH